MFEYADYSGKIEDLKAKTGQAAERAGIGFSLKEDPHQKFRIVFVGQYSAGKSSILRSLTGKTDIAIGAGITTDETHAYEWSGLEVVDTPGIHTEKRPDHDEKSYDAIASADMLVYVVTNELFDSYNAEHFRKIAIDHDKAGEMILVVNKMARADLGNTPEQQKIIRDDLAKVISPYTPEQLRLCFLDADSYLKSLEIRPKSPALADKLLASSGYNGFVATLNRFVREKQLSLRLTTRLYEIDKFLQDAIKQLEPGSGDTAVDGLEENYRQQRHAMFEGQQRLEGKIREIFTDAASKIRNIGMEAANCLEDGCEQEEVERKLSDAVRNAQNIMEKCQPAALLALEEGLKKIDVEIDGIENSEFCKKLKASIESRYESLPDKVKKMLGTVGSWSKEIGDNAVKNSYNAASALKGGLKLSNFSGSNIHNIVKGAGKFIGFKFKPWGALKFTRGVAVAGQVLSVLGAGLTLYLQYRADKDEENMRNELRKNRQNVRSEFDKAASELEDYGRAFVMENVTRQIGASIEQTDGRIKEIRDSRTNKSDSCREMEELHDECLGLIKEIHNQPALLSE